VVLVLLNGSAVAVNWAKEHVPGIVELWYPGQVGGTALADVLFGDYNPGGRLPVTFYQSENQIPPFEDYTMKGKTYRYFEGEPLYPFGYGLSYTRFTYRNLQVPSEVRAGSNLKVAVEVENVGDRAGDEVIQLYLRHVDAPVPVPIRSLEGFRRVTLRPGERRRVEFTLTERQLSMVNAQSHRAVEPGMIEIAVGGLQPGYQAPTTEVVTGTCRITPKN
jgi:beta-glucosidase